LQFEPKNVKAKLIKRYKRFLADVELEDGTILTAHCPNTGSMASCWQKDDIVYLSPSNNPKRKLPFTWELSKTSGGYIGINTHRANHLVHEAVCNNVIPKLKGYKTIKREVKYGDNSKIDLLLTGHGAKPDCYVEVKNVTLFDSEANRVIFPDSVTKRGQKHLVELTKVVKTGARAVMFYLINRPEGKYFAPAKQIDPEYARLLSIAKLAGVELLAYRVCAKPQEIYVDQNMPVKIRFD